MFDLMTGVRHVKNELQSCPVLRVLSLSNRLHSVCTQIAAPKMIVTEKISGFRV